MKHHLPILLAALAFAGLTTAKTIPNYAAADLVLGQMNFTTSAATTTQTGLSYPSGIAIDPVTRKVFIADKANNRVLRYSSAAALATGAAAEAVFGQANFTTALLPAAPTAQSMNFASGLFMDRKGRLWVADSANNRVLMFAAASAIGTNSSASHVYGQPNFTTATVATSASQMRFPRGVWVDGSDRLWVADSDNNRILRFDDVSNKPDGAPASGVLGQPNFTTSTSGNGAAALSYPTGLAVSPSGALFVACSNNHRVVRFDLAAALGNGANASIILGQQDFTGTAPGLSAVQMSSPYGLTTTPDDSLWVSEYSNHRIIRFNNASTKLSGAAADGVIGQPDFLTNAPATTDRGLSFPFISPVVDATGSLWVPDHNNSRVLRFPADSSKPVLTITTKVNKPTIKNSIIIKGTASDPNGISQVQYRIGTGPLKTAIGTTAWQFKARLKKGKNKITVTATDPWGDVSANKILKITRK
jgi:sugar lactone lactonase YvrE